MANSKWQIANKGQFSIQFLIFSGIVVVLLSAVVLWVDMNLRLARRDSNQAAAFAIAEAGIEYYRWHLAHSPNDYQDGTAGPGPYSHNYYDKNGELLGQFILDITPTGSGIVKIKSTGKTIKDPNIEKIIEVTIVGIPLFTKYALVLDADVRFGEGTEVFGPVHSNHGIRFDGLAHNLVTSALALYDDPDHGGPEEFGVHTHVSPTDPLPPNPVPVRSDVFEAGRDFPVPAVDFTGITQILSNIKTDAQASGFYASSSGAFGYEIILKTNNTFDFYRVTALEAPPVGCYDVKDQDDWGLWSIQATSSLGNYPMPTNGLIFVEDDVWLRGQINTANLIIASARFPDNPTTRSNITVNNDLLYTNYAGQDVIVLIAQENINIGLRSEDDLRIDAALMAQNGRVGRYYYRGQCGPDRTKETLTFYGMIGSYESYDFAFTDQSGYKTRNIIYDSNLLYGLSPSFPLTAESYKTIFWEEIK